MLSSRRPPTPLTLLVVLCAALLLAAPAAGSIGFDNCTSTLVDGFAPEAPRGNVKICREGVVAIAYDAEMINPAYSAYHVTPAHVNYSIPGRPSSFYVDPDLRALGVTQAAYRSDAFNTSWNRGHLCPNHIMSYSEEAKHATFTMANVAPQAAYFNQHPWRLLEADVYDWIKENATALHIVTGVAYKDRARARRTFDNISVPDYYFTVVCDAAARQSAGFVGNNTAENREKPLMMSVAQVEAVYGGQLFPAAACGVHALDTRHWWAADRVAPPAPPAATTAEVISTTASMVPTTGSPNTTMAVPTTVTSTPAHSTSTAPTTVSETTALPTNATSSTAPPNTSAGSTTAPSTHSVAPASTTGAAATATSTPAATVRSTTAGPASTTGPSAASTTAPSSTPGTRGPPATPTETPGFEPNATSMSSTAPRPSTSIAASTTGPVMPSPSTQLVTTGPTTHMSTPATTAPTTAGPVTSTEASASTAPPVSAPRLVTATIRIRGSFFAALLANSTMATRLRGAVRADIARLLGVLPSRVVIAALRLGSLVVDFAVHAAEDNATPAMSAPAPAGSVTAADISRQLETSATTQQGWLVDTLLLYREGAPAGSSETLAVESVSVQPVTTATAGPSPATPTATQQQPPSEQGVSDSSCGGACMVLYGIAVIAVVGIVAGVVVIVTKRRASPPKREAASHSGAANPVPTAFDGTDTDGAMQQPTDDYDATADATYVVGEPYGWNGGDETGYDAAYDAD